MKKELIIIVDPLSTGEILFNTIVQRGYEAICIFTLKKETAKQVLKNPAYVEKAALQCIYQSEVNKIISELDLYGYDLKAIIPGSEPGVELASELAHIYKTNSNSKELAAIARNKVKLKCALESKGLLNTRYRKCRTKKDVDNFIKNGHFPYVIKNPNGAGQNQVFICHSLEELHKGFKTIVSQQNLFGLASNYALIEEYVGGKEYAVNLFADGSDVFLTDIWEYEYSETAHAENIFYNMVELSDRRKELAHIIDYTIQVCKSLNVKIGAVHAEIKDDPIKGPVLIDFGLRQCGLRMPFLCQRFSSFDSFHSTLDVFVHGKIDTKKSVEFHKYVAIAFAPTDQSGKVEDIHGIDDIRQLPSYFSHHLKIKPGDDIKPTKELGDIPFYTFLAHESKEQLRRDMEQVHQSFKIVCHKKMAVGIPANY